MKKLILSLFALPLLLCACEEPVNVQDTVSLKITSEAEASYPAKGGDGIITYELTNATDATLLQATTEAEWITITSTAEEIAYSVAANTTAAEREAVITVSYNDLSGAITVRQAAAVITEGWGIIGSMTNNWDTNSVIAMPLANGYYGVCGVTLTTTDSFRFIKDSSYDENRGGNGLVTEAGFYYQAVKNGSDIRVAEDGTYDIYLNEALNTFYIMAQGKLPESAIEPILPGVDTWSIIGNFEGNSYVEDIKLNEEESWFTAKNIVFSSEGSCTFAIRKNKSDAVRYGAVENIEQEVNLPFDIALTSEGGNSDIVVNAEAGVAYDIFFSPRQNKAWVLSAGQTPIEWTTAVAVCFNSHNFSISLSAHGLDLFLDFNCGTDATDMIIPEGVYYVNANDQDNGNNFNLDYTLVRYHGVRSTLIDGTMTIKHISGGYDILVDVRTMHFEDINVRYFGPLDSNPMMGPEVQNPI